MTLAKSSKRILIIDDEPDICETICEFLKDHYESVSFATDSQKVESMLVDNHYDLILSDIKMPKLSGPDLIGLLRSKGYLTLVIFVSGHVNLQNALMALRLGASDVVEKPFSHEDLLLTIVNAFEIEKRRIDLYEEKKEADKQSDGKGKKSKMIGLLQASTAKRKSLIA